MPKKNSDLVKMMSLINKGREIINSQEIKQDIVMFVGMTGSGKSTLINCINGVELEHFFDTSIRIDRLRVKDTFAPLPGVDIGHTKYSCTRHPAIYNPQNKTFSYVDLPGFGDTGNPMVDKSTFGNTKLQSDKMAQDVANAFFRQAVADRSEKYKVVFVLEYNDIISKGGNLSRTIDDFCNFMGGVNSEEKEVIDGIKKSMRIVVTKVPTDPQRKEFEEGIDKLSAEISVINNKMGAADHLIDQLNGLAVNDGLTAIITATKAESKALKDQKNVQEDKKVKLENELKALPSSETFVKAILGKYIAETIFESKQIREILLDVVNSDRFALFSMPVTGEVSKIVEERDHIKHIIEDDVDYIKKEDANITAKVSKNHEGNIVRAIADIEQAETTIARKIYQDISTDMKNSFSSGNAATAEFRDHLMEILIFTDKTKLMEFINKLGQKITLSPDTINAAKDFEGDLSFLVSLLRESHCGKVFQEEKNWVKEFEMDLQNSALNNYIKGVDTILNREDGDVIPKLPQNVLEGDKLTISGYFIKTSQIDEIIQKHNGFKNVVVNALHTIVIDHDLNENNAKCGTKLHGVNLTMISPNLEVSGTRRVIDLSGTPGKSQSPAVGVQPNGVGTHGNPGLPGQSGGSFVCISDHLTGLEKLTIKIKGGKGGTGQQGAQGGPGLPALKDALYLKSTNDVWTEVGKDESGYTRFYWMQKPAQSGGQGKKGGDGGVGGNSGQEGMCKIIQPSLREGVVNDVVIIDRGTEGKGDPGTPGDGGIGGENGFKVQRKYRKYGNQEKWDDDEMWVEWHGGNGIPPSGRGSGVPGDPGTRGANGTASGPDTDNSYNQCLGLLNYKIFLEQDASKLKTLVGDSLHEFLYTFKKHCDEVKATDIHTTVKDLVEEFKVLEGYIARESVDFMPYYQSFVTRVKNYATVNSSDTNDLKMLEYLFTATLGRINNLNAANNTLLVIDIPGYLELTNQSIETLKTFKGEQLREHYHTLYEAQINDKIEEANRFIDVLKKNISYKQQDIAPQIAKLVQNVNAALVKAGNNKEAVQNEIHKLEEAISKNTILGVLGIVASGVGMLFPPMGPIVAGVVNAGLDMAKDQSPDNIANFVGQVCKMGKTLEALPTHPAYASQQEKELFAKISNIVDHAKPIVKDTIELFKIKAKGETKLTQLRAQVEEIEEQIKKLNKYKDNVPDAFGKYLENTVVQATNFQDSLKDKSLSALDFSKLESRKFFDTIKQNIKTLTGNFPAGDWFVAIVAELEEAMEISVNICSRVQDYREQILFADYLAHLHSPGILKLDAGQYNQDIGTLNVEMQKNIVQEHYYRITSAVKQWAFPFAQKFLGGIHDLHSSDYALIASNITSILNQVKIYHTTIQNIDQSIILESFKDVSPVSPFFVWSYENYPQQLERVLDCKGVILNADIRSVSKDAVKFNKIGVKFTCAEQHKLDNILGDHFQVKLTHSGNSYYKFADNIYEMSNDKPLEITYSFKMDNGVPIKRSNTYDKMAKGDLLLSPYTSWVIQLEKISKDDVVNLHDSFKHLLDSFKISLVGEGSEVNSSRVDVNDLNMDKYYHAVHLGDLNIEDSL